MDSNRNYQNRMKKTNDKPSDATLRKANKRKQTPVYNPSINESKLIVPYNYTGQKRMLFRVRCSELKKLFQSFSSSPYERDDREYPSKHKLLSRLHFEYNEELQYGTVSIASKKEMQIFLKFEVDVDPNKLLVDIKSFLREDNFDSFITFIITKNEENGLREVSNLDTDTVHSGTLCSSNFSKHWHRMQFFKQCPNELDLNHWYVTTYCNTESARSSLWASWRKWKMSITKLRPHYLIYEGDFDGWQLEVVKWKNMHASLKEWKPKTPQLFLHGESGAGKTSFIDFIFKPYDNQKFIPLQGSKDGFRFQYEGFSEHLHNWVKFDEFTFEGVIFENWKLLLDGNDYKQDVKFVNCGDTFKMRCPFVMISNHPPYKNVSDVNDIEAIRNRILEVVADKKDKYFEFLNPRFKLRYYSLDKKKIVSLEELEEEIEREKAFQRFEQLNRSQNASSNTEEEEEEVEEVLPSQTQRNLNSFNVLPSTSKMADSKFSKQIKDNLREKVIKKSEKINLFSNSNKEIKTESNEFEQNLLKSFCAIGDETSDVEIIEASEFKSKQEKNRRSSVSSNLRNMNLD